MSQKPIKIKTNDYLLAIDNGTQSVRALIFDSKGQVIAKSQVDLDTYFSNTPGWAEQEPDYYWQMLCKACRQLMQQIDFPKSQLKAAALTTQRATMVNLDNVGGIQNCIHHALPALKRKPSNKGLPI